MSAENMLVEHPEFSVRYAQASDCESLLTLMHLLAKFEGYDKEFCVTHADLFVRGFSSMSAQFRAIVAESIDQKLLGYALVYQVNFTFDLRPNLHLKELFVTNNAR